MVNGESAHYGSKTLIVAILAIVERIKTFVNQLTADHSHARLLNREKTE